jgi:hypothetical protein
MGLIESGLSALGAMPFGTWRAGGTAGTEVWRRLAIEGEESRARLGYEPAHPSDPELRAVFERAQRQSATPVIAPPAPVVEPEPEIEELEIETETETPTRRRLTRKIEREAWRAVGEKRGDG